jgi:hypothetical protein
MRICRYRGLGGRILLKYVLEKEHKSVSWIQVAQDKGPRWVLNSVRNMNRILFTNSDYKSAASVV